jgi:hypothetical protein
MTGAAGSKPVGSIRRVKIMDDSDYTSGSDYGSVDYGTYDTSYSGNQAFDDYITGNDPSSYDSLSPNQGFDYYITDNQCYGWDTDNGSGTVWATGDPSIDQYNFGY